MEYLKTYNQRARSTITIAGALGLIYVVINLFVIGGDNFVYSLNNNITIPLAIISTVFAFSLWDLVKTGLNRLLWGGLLLGWALWTIAEVLWVVYGYIYQEIPYPSPADFFWLIGYIPMGLGLYSRIREIPVKLSQAQKMVLWATSLTTILITFFFILIPIIQNNDATRWLESALNIIYPLADLFLLIIVLRLIFVYRSGDYGFGWNLLAVGFILHSISNLIFSYASLSDLYYPDLKVNFISGMAVDVPYNLSYLFWFIGLYALRITLSRHQPFEVIVQPKLVPNTSIIVYLKGDDTAIGVSDNFSYVFGTIYEKGRSLTSLLHITEQEAQSILNNIRSEKKISDLPIQVKNRFGTLQDAYLSGLATASSNGEYSGCNLLFRTLVENDYALDEKLTQEEKLMASYLRRKSGSNERAQIRKLLLDYYLAYLKQLYNLAFRTGGAQLGLAFLEHLEQTAEEHQWPLEFDLETLLVDTEYELSLLREAFPILLESSRLFTTQLIDSITVEVEMQSISSQFSEAVHQNVMYYSK